MQHEHPEQPAPQPVERRTALTDRRKAERPTPDRRQVDRRSLRSLLRL